MIVEDPLKLGGVAPLLASLLLTYRRAANTQAFASFIRNQRNGR